MLDSLKRKKYRIYVIFPFLICVNDKATVQNKEIILSKKKNVKTRYRRFKATVSLNLKVKLFFETRFMSPSFSIIIGQIT